MATVSRGLPQRPHLDVPKREARELLKHCRANEPEALERIQRRHPKFHKADPAGLAAFRLSDAQLVIAREYGFSSWPQLKERIDANTLAGLLDKAIRANDGETVTRVLRANPQLLHVPVWSGNWGPPMSHAANLGRLEMIKLIAPLGAKDFQHALDRALLQGKLECARWFLQNGANLTPGLVMGACETLNPDGLGLLDELNAPFTDGKGDPLAPLGLVLETYSRNPSRKHAVLKIFSRRGYRFPDTGIMALHCGDIERMKHHLRRDPKLIERRFTLREIYPPEVGCGKDGRGGMCGTPLAGTTLLHLAIDFDEREIFDFLLAHGADANARASVDAEGFGGQTPLFNAIVSCAGACGLDPDTHMIRSLLERGASPNIRASVRKFLDWRETPFWHVARDVTPAEWGRGFPEQGWVNMEGVRLVEEAR